MPIVRADYQSDTETNEQQLKVESIKVSQTGEMTVTFNRKIFGQPFKYIDDRRALLALEDIITVVVTDTDDEDTVDDGRNKTISSINFLQSNETSIRLQLDFADPGAITIDIREPDYIFVRFV